mmetsp:Transcript_3203/g.7794  ORF Transcript_3203/g.7794 Transcript_3203/m.7794 type:complete len:214 (+) Transcript_3203:265-906(+)
MECPSKVLASSRSMWLRRSAAGTVDAAADAAVDAAAALVVHLRVVVGVPPGGDTAAPPRTCKAEGRRPGPAAAADTRFQPDRPSRLLSAISHARQARKNLQSFLKARTSPTFGSCGIARQTSPWAAATWTLRGRRISKRHSRSTECHSTGGKSEWTLPSLAVVRAAHHPAARAARAAPLVDGTAGRPRPRSRSGKGRASPVPDAPVCSSRSGR